MKKLAKRKFMNWLLIVALVFPNFSGLMSSVSAEGVQAEDLFISEYIEGGSFNKAIEIFNGTGQEVDLSQYSLALYSNGASEASNTVTLSGMLAHGDVFVAAHNQAASEILQVADLQDSNVINFNGNDAIALKKGDTILDVVGTIGVDTVFAVDETLVKYSYITAGTSTYTETEWQAFPKDTLDYIGTHTMDGVAPVDPGEPKEPIDPSEVLTIEEARNAPLNTTVTIEGIVTADNAAIGGGRLSTYIQDETAGINLFDFDATGYQELQKGDKVKVTGKLDEYNGLKEIVPSSPDNVEVLSSGNTLPAPQEITLADMQDEAIAEPLEGSIVKVNGYVSSVPSSPAGGGYNVSLMDADFNSTTLRVMEDALDISNVKEGKWYDITAVLSQYNTYQLIPTEASDIVLADEQPEAPSAAGQYPAVVESVTDGDTIRLAAPVLGSERVRFVNMDTPETYHSVQNELDQNQLDHGIAAKEYIQTLLQPGDEITLKIGDEPTDDYGRLLAQVVTNDGVNVNLKMVQEGYASTYFIWPVGDETDYETFQTAVKEAKDAGLGIWNPEDPLLELPFAFRARYEGKGLLRYVGNSDTKEYVYPEDYEEVPVEKRIFFVSAEEAEENGYTPAESVEDNENIKVQILSVNDLHGKIDVTEEINGVDYGRIDYLAAYLEEREATNPDNTVLVHAGDMVGGSPPVSALLQDEPTVHLMEEMGFDVGTVGNHEFDEGVAEMLRLINGGDHENGTDNYDGIDFPMVAANVVYKDSGDLVLDPYTVQEVAGQKIGFIGVATVDTPNMIISKGNENIEFTDEATAINQYAEELKNQGVQAIIVLAHVPGDQSGSTVTGDIANIANEVDDEVDVIFAAHNHVKLDGVVDGKLIVQAGEYGKAFADVDLEIDPATGDIVKKTAEVVDVIQEGMTPDPEATAILNDYLEQVGPKLNEVIGVAEVALPGGYAAFGEIGDNPLGNLIADGMIAAMDSDFALMNGGGIRADLNAGEITWSELFNVQPFGNTLVKVEITGAELRDVLNTQFSGYGPDVLIGGFSYTWDSSLGDYGQVVDLFLPDGSKLDEAATYTVTVNNYMYPHSSDKYRLFELGENPVQGPDDLQATVDFVKSFDGPIDYTHTLGRISEVDSSEEPETPEEEETVITPIVEGGTVALTDDQLENVGENSTVVIDVPTEEFSTLKLTKEQVALLKEKNVKLEIANKNTTLVIPASILGNGDAEIGVSEAAEVENSDAAVSPVYEFTILVDGKELHAFEDSVTLQLKVDPSNVSNPESVKLYYFNEQTSEWELIGGTYVDGILTATTEHFSKFAAFEINPNQVDGTNGDTDGEDSATDEGTNNGDEEGTYNEEANANNGNDGTDNGNTSGENKLPNTATNSYNLLLMSGILLASGFVLFVLQRRRAKA
ncbi:5'-nucleotidase C-terminal domain-containing protein [Salirhabdus sp. Marseille-P4669]|uniref:5'-nucleotidase C-terminal domain-containing protein n=1 Tax=Salirhabdus sp. Marseille-P4669 TaxID=2042310 RepID=UPI000C7D4943|nr:5'-nucleotidase C-terminal domain-containing protein [Salirhabdus sp. Marseille-P4669]